MNSILTICTPTYNRAELLNRPFESLMKQSNKNFIWLIIDDGSTDNTKQVVSEFIKKASFPIVYKYKENGGRHTALNFSYQFITTDFVLNLDSDDELVYDCVEKLEKYIKLIANNKKIWQIVGLCINQENKLIGNRNIKKLNNYSGRKQRKKSQKYIFEKSCCRRVSVLKQYLFPVYNDTKFVTESTVWEKCNLKYDSYYIDDILRIYYQNTTDSIMNSKSKTSFSRMKSRYYFSNFCLNYLYCDKKFNKNYKFARYNIARAAICCNIKMNVVLNNIQHISTRLYVLFIGYPIAFVWVLIKKEKK